MCFQRKHRSSLCIAANHQQILLTVLFTTLPTVVAVVVHQDDLFEKVRGSPVHGRVNGAKDDRQSLVHEDEHDADLREVCRIGDIFAPMENSW